MKARIKAGLYRLTDPDLIRLTLIVTPAILTIIGLLLPGDVATQSCPHTGGMCNGGG